MTEMESCWHSGLLQQMCAVIPLRLNPCSGTSLLAEPAVTGSDKAVVAVPRQKEQSGSGSLKTN